jgi:hypothetical protein
VKNKVIICSSISKAVCVFILISTVISFTVYALAVGAIPRGFTFTFIALLFLVSGFDTIPERRRQHE